MKKVLLSFIAFTLVVLPVFADEAPTESDTTIESIMTQTESLDELSDFEDFDDIEDIDDLDALFEDAEEDIVVEEAPVPKVEQKTENSSILKLTGSFSSKLGVACVYDDTKKNSETETVFTPGGLIDISNTLSISAKPSDLFGVYGSMAAGFSGKFALSVSNLYFNSLLFDAVYLSAGKKSISWGNLRIFSTPVLSDSGSGISCEIRYPWKLGTLTGIVLYDYNKYGTSSSGFTWKNMSFAAAGDITVFNTNINAFVRKNPEPAANTDKVAEVLTGLELKRTIFGFDTYVQGVVYFEKEFKKVIATGGFYRLWDSFTPNIGINIEYRYTFDQTLAKNENTKDKAHSHLINTEFGVKKLGPNKNMKVGVKWNHDFMKESGNVDIAFIISSLIPYADWTNGVKITYDKDRDIPKFEFGSALSFSVSY